METSPLNAAHECERRVSALLNEGKFEEAAECHEKVANFLAEALSKFKIHHQLNSNSSDSLRQDSVGSTACVQVLTSLESLALQRDHHNREAERLRMKQGPFQEYKPTLESEPINFLNNQEVNKESDLESINDNDLLLNKSGILLKQAIFRTIKEQDSLLSVLELPKVNENSEPEIFKHPKDTVTVIEELRTVNFQLRSLLGNLLNELDKKEEEIQQLKERLYALASESGRQQVHQNDDLDSLHLSPLPPLIPLEMPPLDFSST